jgi:hypothetical protein
MNKTKKNSTKALHICLKNKLKKDNLYENRHDALIKKKKFSKFFNENYVFSSVIAVEREATKRFAIGTFSPSLLFFEL